MKYLKKIDKEVDHGQNADDNCRDALFGADGDGVRRGFGGVGRGKRSRTKHGTAGGGNLVLPCDGNGGR